MKRIALFIGVNDYEDPGISGLRCAVNDARELAGLFQHRLGFKTELITDVELRKGRRISTALRELGRGLGAGDTFLFYFAGHGKTTADPDQIFLLPDASRAGLDRGIVAGEGILSWRGLRAETDGWAGVNRIFVFDACRSLLETEKEAHRDGENLARFDGEIIYRDLKLGSKPANNQSPLVVLNSCADGQRAEELAAYPGGRGLFSAALGEVILHGAEAGQALRTSSALADDIARQMQKLVKQYENRDSQQRPFLTGAEIELASLTMPKQNETAVPPTGQSLDERLWLITLGKVRRSGSTAEKIELLEEHMADTRIEACCHVDAALEQIAALEQAAEQSEQEAEVKRQQAEQEKQKQQEEIARKEQEAREKAEREQREQEAEIARKAQAKEAAEKRIKDDANAWQATLSVVALTGDLQAQLQAYKTYANQWQNQRVEALARIAELERQIKQAEADEKNRQEEAKRKAREEKAIKEKAERERQAVEAARRADPRSFKPGKAGEAVPKLCPEAPEMVAIPPGKFQMGSSEAEQGKAIAAGTSKERGSFEYPRHEVQIGYWLAVGKCAVTFDEWDRFAAETGGYIPKDEGWGRGKRPVINVSWRDAQNYVEWLNKKAGLQHSPHAYRLLNEAEWEYACRAGTTTAFWWGDSICTDQANYDGNDQYNGSPKGEYRQKTVPVDSFQPNPWGLYQMHGNVTEWVQDCNHDNYIGAPNNGSAWETGGNQCWRVLRGGSWGGGPCSLRAAYRNSSFTPDFRFISGGFRLARTLP